MIEIANMLDSVVGQKEYFSTVHWRSERDADL